MLREEEADICDMPAQRLRLVKASVEEREEEGSGRR